MRGMWPAAAVTFSIALRAASAAAQAPVGPEFRVNTVTTGSVYASAVASRTNGDFVIVWSTGDGFNQSRVTGQRFDAGGARLGTEFLVSVYTTSFPDLVSVSADANGFTVVWDDLTGFPNRARPFGRRFDANGNPVGVDFAVSSYTSDVEVAPHVASDASGGFVVVWTRRGVDGDGSDWGVFGQRFTASGGRIGAEFAVNSFTTGAQYWADVGVQPGGDFVVAWGSQPGLLGQITAQRFAAGGTKLGGEFKVSTSTDIQRIQAKPTLRMMSDGSFVVAWYELASPRHSILTRIYDAQASPLGPDVVAHAYSSQFPFPGSPALSPIQQGNWMVAWWSPSGAASSRMHARSFDQSGLALTAPLDFGSLNVQQAWPALSSDGTGRAVAAWLVETAPGSAAWELHAQRFGLLGPSALAVDTSAGATSDGNRVLEPGETVDVRPTWRNNTGFPLAMNASLAALTGPPADYTIVDGAGSYGTVGAGGMQQCTDCYRVNISANTRPAVHWDASVSESINGGDDGMFRWGLHLGDSFGDVARTSSFYPFVETLLHRGVTAGCGATTFCPATAVTREQMAVFSLAAKEEPGFVPYPCRSPMFADVPAESPFCSWIEELARRGVSGGCGGGNYCPDAAVSREQMAVFVLRTLDPALNPPACTTPIFNDVPASSPFCRWIEELARRGIVSGCGGGSYCPAAPVTREQMSVFLTGTFGLTLYGP